MKTTLVFAALGCLIGALACPSIYAVELDIREGRAIVSGVYVNGNGPYRFLVDTGATWNHMDPELAESLGLNSTFRSQIRTSTGVAAASGSSGLDVAIGDVRANEQTFLFSDLSAVHQLSPNIQGILGQSFLSRFDYYFDWNGHRLEFGTRETDPKGIRTEFRIDQGRPMVPTNLGWMVLDSGAHKLTRFGIAAPEPTYQMITLSGTVQLGTVPAKLIIAGRTFWHGEAIAVPQAAENDAQGLLPANVFKFIYVCNSQGYAVFD